MKVFQVWCLVFHVLKQSLVSSKGLQHLNCSNIAIVWEKQHVNADEIRWIRQLWSKPHWVTRVWFVCGSVLAAGVKSMITLYVLIHGSGCLSLHGYQSCHIVRISVCWLLVCFWLTYTNIYSTFISCRRTMWSLYSPSVNFFSLSSWFNLIPCPWKLRLSLTEQQPELLIFVNFKHICLDKRYVDY